MGNSERLCLMWNWPKSPERIVVDELILIDIHVNMFQRMSIQKSSLRPIHSGFLGPFHIRRNRSELPIYTVLINARTK